MFDRSQFIAILAGAAGGVAAIGIMEALSITTAFPLVAIPFATSIVVVLGSPKAEPGQPRALIGGHLISTLVGLAIVKICGPHHGPRPWPSAWRWSRCISPALFIRQPASIRWSLSSIACRGVS